MVRLVYVLALERSGSTPLSFHLARYRGVVSLGKVGRTLGSLAKSGAAANRDCSCGEAAARCPVWGPLHARRGDLAALSMADRYGLMLDVVARVVGRDAVVVDMSKSLDGLDTVVELFGDRLAVLFLVKDVRNYLNSIRTRAETKPDAQLLPKRFKATIAGRLGRLAPSALVHVIHWRRRNREMDGYLGRNRLTSLRLGYEELCLDGANLAPAIEAVLGVDGPPGPASGARHHVLMGNFPYLRQVGAQALRYDRLLTMCLSALVPDNLAVPQLPRPSLAPRPSTPRLWLSTPVPSGPEPLHRLGRSQPSLRPAMSKSRASRYPVLSAPQRNDEPTRRRGPRHRRRTATPTPRRFGREAGPCEWW